MTPIKWFWINIILKLFDIGTTAYLVKKMGYEVEANPIVKKMFYLIGAEATYLINIAIFVPIVYIVYRYKQTMALKVSFVIMALVVINNFVAIILWR